MSSSFGFYYISNIFICTKLYWNFRPFSIFKPLYLVVLSCSIHTIRFINHQ